VSQVKSDKIYQSRLTEITEFKFDEKVAAVFDDMISRSVPRYQEVQSATVKLAMKLCREGGTIIDLGCSTGTTLFAIAEEARNQDLDLKLIGVDNSGSMLNEADKKARALGLENSVSFVCQDILETKIHGVSLVILNYTLQFLPVEGRKELLEKIYNAISPGGGVILAEKLKHSGVRSEDILRELYYDFKSDNGYSKLEISQKREALEGFLVPLTLEENLELLRSAGFEDVELYLKWITFATFLALKS